MIRSRTIFFVCLVATFSIPGWASQNSTTEILTRLKSTDAKERAEAVHQLAMAVPPAKEALPALIEALADPNKTIRRSAAMAVSRYGNHAESCAAALIKNADRLDDVTVLMALGRLRAKSKDAVAFCVKKLAAKSIVTRMDAVETLEKMGPSARAAIPGLIAAMDETTEPKTDPIIFQAFSTKVYQSLNAIGTPRAEDVPSLAQLLRHKAQPVRFCAANMLLAPGVDTKPVVQELIAALGDEKDSDVKWRIVDALAAARTDAKAAVPPLIETLQDADEFVVVAAARTLGQLGKVAHPAEKALVAVFKGHREPRCRVAAAAALIQIAPANHTKEALLRLEKELLNKESEVRMAAAVALARLGPTAKTAVPGLLKAFETEEAVYVRSPIALALHAIDPELTAKKVTPRLVADIQFKKEFVPWWAAVTLVEIDPKTAGKIAGHVLFEAANADRGPLSWKAAQAFDSIADDAVPHLVKKFTGNVTAYRRGFPRLGDKSAIAFGKELNAKDRLTRVSVVFALGEMGPAAKKAVPALVDALKEKDVELRHAMAVALAKIDSEAAARHAIDILIQSLSYTKFFKGDEIPVDEGPPVRCEAAAALGRLGAYGFAALPALKKTAATDRDESVRKAATAALKAICP